MKEIFKEEELVKILKNSSFNQKYMITLKIWSKKTYVENLD